MAPADGKVVSVDEMHESAFLGAMAVRISIFMNVFDCHVNRYPVSGTIEYRFYNPGKFLNAAGEKASLDNEQSSIGVGNSRGRVLIRQIAGLIARRIVTLAPMQIAIFIVAQIAAQLLGLLVLGGVLLQAMGPLPPG